MAWIWISAKEKLTSALLERVLFSPLFGGDLLVELVFAGDLVGLELVPPKEAVDVVVTEVGVGEVVEVTLVLLVLLGCCGCGATGGRNGCPEFHIFPFPSGPNAFTKNSSILALIKTHHFKTKLLFVLLAQNYSYRFSCLMPVTFSKIKNQTSCFLSESTNLTSLSHLTKIHTCKVKHYDQFHKRVRMMITITPTKLIWSSLHLEPNACVVFRALLQLVCKLCVWRGCLWDLGNKERV